jgi:hypothetical protein
MSRLAPVTWRALAVAGALSVALQPASGFAQEGQRPAADARPAGSSVTLKRLPDGQPDIQGIYISGWSVPYERYSEAERKAWQAKMEAVRGPDPGAYGLEWTEINIRKGRDRQPKPGTVQVIDPPDGRIPWQPWALAKKNYIRDNPYERAEFLDSRVRCLPAGPRFVMTSAYNGWQILQPPGYVIILQEHNHNSRIIPIGTRQKPLSPTMQLWQGDSRGRWEGNTLVVESTNYTDKTWIVGEAGGEGMSGGSFHSTALRLVERFTVVDADNIDYEATVTDENVFTRPWKMAFGIWSRAPQGYENYEFACHEGNKSVELTEVLFKESGEASPSGTPSTPK